MDSTSSMSRGISDLSEWIDDANSHLPPEALTALAALEHLRGHDARSLDLLAERLEATLRRAGSGA